MLAELARAALSGQTNHRVDVRQDDVESEVEKIDAADGDHRLAGDDHAAVEQVIECIDQRELDVFLLPLSQLRAPSRSCMPATGRKAPVSPRRARICARALRERCGALPRASAR